MKKINILLLLVLIAFLAAGCKTTVVTGKSKRPEVVTEQRPQVQKTVVEQEKPQKEEDFIK